MKQTIIASLMSAAILFAAPAAFEQEAEEKENYLSGGYIGMSGRTVRRGFAARSIRIRVRRRRRRRILSGFTAAFPLGA